MDNIILYIIVVLVVLALALWAITILPLPGAPVFIKGLLMFLCVCLAAFAVARKGGML
jgi:VIT1/CCC1 family predicted Fe2+/Mn2+ transporter